VSLRVTDEGEVIALKALLNHTAGQNLVLKLYQNNITPADADTAATYTEATFTGYANLTLTGASWTVSPGAPGVASYAQQTFTSSADQAAQNIYGYFLTQLGSGTLVYAERFTGAPFVIQNNGDSIKVTPRVTCKDELD
jgi:hypothetical protein